MGYHVARAAGEDGPGVLHAEIRALRPEASEDARALVEHDGCGSALGAARGTEDAVAPSSRRCAACV